MSDVSEIVCTGGSTSHGNGTANSPAVRSSQGNDNMDDDIVCLGRTLRAVSLVPSASGKIKGKRKADDMEMKPAMADDKRQSSHKILRGEMPTTGRFATDVHHRDTFAPPPGTPSESDIEHELERLGGIIDLDGFILYRPLPGKNNGRGPTCSLQIFDYDTSSRALQDREQTKRSRDVLVDSVVMYGTIGGTSSRRLGVILSSLITYKVISNKEFQCSIIMVTSLRQYRLRRPSERYVELFHAFWILHQGAADICRAAIRSPDITAIDYVNQLKEDAKTKPFAHSSKTGQMASCSIPKSLFIDELALIRATFTLYSRTILHTAILTTSTSDTLLQEIKGSELFKQLHVLAGKPRQERRRELGLLNFRQIPRDGLPILTAILEETKRKTLKKYEVKIQRPLASDRPVYSVVGLDDEDNDGRMKWLVNRDSRYIEVAMEAGRTERQWDGARLNGVEYWVGDVVEIRTSVNKHNRAMIRTLKRITGPGRAQRQLAHVHWLCQLPVGSPYELFLEDCGCDTIAIRHISRKVDCLVITSDQIFQVPHGQMFCRFISQRDVRVRQIPNEHTRGDTCDSCCRKAEILALKEVKRNCRTLNYLETSYHVDDFAYIDVGVPGVAHTIGHVQEILSEMVRIRTVRRYAELKHSDYEFVDQARLYATNEIQTVPITSIRGRCLVFGTKNALSAITSPIPSYYCDSRVINLKADSDRDLIQLRQPLRQCGTCLESFHDLQQSHSKFDELVKMPFADFYSGGGGGIMSAIEYFDVKLAVEMNPVACNTLEQNHPGLSVFCSTVDVLHDNTLKAEAGKMPGAIYDKRDEYLPLSRQKKLGLLPARGTMVGYMAGIPCQGHSRTNRFQDPNDPRNEELFKMMSEIDRACPDFVVLENVAGFKDARDDGTFIDPAATTSWAHLAVSLLIKLDYQVQLAILDSRSYVSPQNRSRLWIVAARRGVPLPKLPDATHANPHVKLTMFSLDGNTPTGFYVDSTMQTTPGSGIHPAITIKDAIGDLPAFEYLPPSATLKPKRNAVPLFNSARSMKGANTRVGYDWRIDYKCPALNPYQETQRQGSIQLTDHITPSRSPAELQLVYAAFSESDPPGNARRMNPGGGFYTLLTNSAPGGKATEPIHYDQRRTRSIAESKRAMGFPDTYELAGTPAEMDSQLGNAWVVQMGQAIVSSIRDVIRREWITAGEPENLFEWWRKAHPVPPRENV